MSQKIGRPTKITPATVGKLVDSFKHGATVVEACYYAGISRDTFYSHYGTNKVFSDNIDRSRSWLIMKAKRNIAEAVLAGDLKQSAWLLEKNLAIGANLEQETMNNFDVDTLNRQRQILEDYIQRRIEQQSTP